MCAVGRLARLRARACGSAGSRRHPSLQFATGQRLPLLSAAPRSASPPTSRWPNWTNVQNDGLC